MKSASVIRCFSAALVTNLLLSALPGTSLAMEISTNVPHLKHDPRQAPVPVLRIEDPQSTYLRAVAAEQGEGTLKYETQAAELYRCAAEKNYAPAQYSLALLYEEGRGVKQNFGLAARWHRSSAEQGYAEAQNNLGLLYKHGSGVPRGLQQAFMWFKRAALQGNIEGTTNTADAYREGIGIGKHLPKALQLYREAALAGNASAQNNLGSMYANGEGADRDYSTACAWLSIAAEQLSQSAEILDKLRTQMTSKDVVRARQMWGELHKQIAIEQWEKQ